MEYPILIINLSVSSFISISFSLRILKFCYQVHSDLVLICIPDEFISLSLGKILLFISGNTLSPEMHLIYSHLANIAYSFSLD